MLEVDDEGGRMFLRVLIHLTMHDYPPLVSGALQLLFKHFSQRQEAMHTFKQVRPRSARPSGSGWGEGGRGMGGRTTCTEEAGCPGHVPPVLGTGVSSDGRGAHSTCGVLGLAELLKSWVLASLLSLVHRLSLPMM